MKDAPADTKSNAGRPLKFETVSDLRQKIESYFSNCDPHVSKRIIFKTRGNGEQYQDQEEFITEQLPYGIEGLARALRTTRETINKYESGDYDDKTDMDEAGNRFSDTIKEAKARIREQMEMRMLTGQAPATPSIFWMKNNAGWVDQHQVDHTTKGQAMPLLGGTTPMVEDVPETPNNTEGGDDEGRKPSEA